MARKKAEIVPVPDPPTVRSVIEELPEEDVKQALLGSNDPIAMRFIQLWMDPRNYGKDISLLAKKAEFSLAHFEKVWRDHAIHKGMVLLAARAPKVMQDVAIDAESRMEMCPECEGDGNVVIEIPAKDGEFRNPQIKTCRKCEGSGKVRVAGDRHARSLVFETLKLTGQGAPLVAIQQNFGESLGQTVGAVEKMIGWSNE